MNPLQEAKNFTYGQLAALVQKAGGAEAVRLCRQKATKNFLIKI